MTVKKDPREELHVVVGDVRVLRDELPPVGAEVAEGDAGVAGDLHLIGGLPNLQVCQHYYHTQLSVHLSVIQHHTTRYYSRLYNYSLCANTFCANKHNQGPFYQDAW